MSRKETLDHSSLLFDRTVFATYGYRIKTVLSMISFWCAIVFPVAYLSVLILDVESVNAVLLFFGLVVVNVLALIGGHSYRNS